MTKADFDWLKRPGDEGINFSDIPEITPEMVARAQAAPPLKVRITTHVDADILAWLKRRGPRYQTRINLLLREAMNVDRTSARRRRSA